MITLQDLKKYEDYIIEKRRDIHQHPEPGFKEFRTSKLIENELRSFGYDLVTGVGTTGIVATLNAGHPGKTVLLRADIDALVMQEENDVPYKSLNDGVMHACGHDTHTAMLLGAAKYFSEHKNELNGTVKLVFQAAEEGPMPGGGIFVVKEGHLDDVDAVFGTHISSGAETGTLSIKKGPAMAAPDEFRITIHGKGTHASTPQTGHDPIITAAQVISNLQTIISRQISPLDSAVISVCTIHGGTAFNVIPDHVTFTGTIRTLDESVRQSIFQKITDTTNHVAAMYGCTADVDLIEAYPPLINDNEMSEFVMDIAKELIGDNAVFNKNPIMGGEDFAYYLQKKPGCFFFLGGKHPDVTTPVPHHNPTFDIDESSFLYGLAMHVNIVTQFLNK